MVFYCSVNIILNQLLKTTILLKLGQKDSRGIFFERSWHHPKGFAILFSNSTSIQLQCLEKNAAVKKFIQLCCEN